MKKHTLLLALGIMLTALPLGLAAKSFEKAYLETYQGRPAPVPVSIVRPFIDAEFAGTELNLVFTIDKHGRPRGIVSRPYADRDLVKPLVDAVSRWTFTPLVGANGEPVAARVVLPVRVLAP